MGVPVTVVPGDPAYPQLCLDLRLKARHPLEPKPPPSTLERTLDPRKRDTAAPLPPPNSVRHGGEDKDGCRVLTKISNKETGFTHILFSHHPILHPPSA